jgi:hypothetical protein
MVKARCALFVAMALVVGGCSAVSETWNDWFGESPTPAPTAPAAANQGSEVFYAAIDGLVLHTLPSGSSPVVARLTLHQRLTRTGITRGYANVTTEAGLQGWVDNAQLLWRLPIAPAATAAPVEPSPASVGAEAAPTAAAAEVPTAAEAVDTPLPTATAPSAPAPSDTPTAQPTKAGAAPAIFDPF